MRYEISNNVVRATSKTSDQHAHIHSLIRAFEYSMSVKLQTEYHLESLRLKEATQARLSQHHWKSHVTAQL